MCCSSEEVYIRASLKKIVIGEDGNAGNVCLEYVDIVKWDKDEYVFVKNGHPLKLTDEMRNLEFDAKKYSAELLYSFYSNRQMLIVGINSDAYSKICNAETSETSSVAKIVSITIAGQAI